MNDGLYSSSVLTSASICSYRMFVANIFFGCICFDREDAVAALKNGEEQLKMLQRQATISQLYPSARSVME